MSSSTISVVVPVYKGGEVFRTCLETLRDSLCSPTEIIVVSDGDTDTSWQIARDFGVKVLRLKTNGGPARARNIGAKAAQGDILFFIDADVALHPEALGLVKQQFEQFPDLAALIGSYDDAPGENNFLSQYKNLFHHYTHQHSSENASTFWGACGAIRRSVFITVGGFDESYRRPCIEDIELGYRLKRAGYDIRLCKDIWVKHLKRWDFFSLLKAEIFYRAIPWSELILSEKRLDADLNLDYSNRLSVLMVFALIISFGVGWFTSWWWISAVIVLGLLLINFKVYQFFYVQRGGLFTLRVIPWHWFYFLYGGSAFAYVVCQHYIGHFLRIQNPMKVFGVRGSR